jgi:hypothetical protein
MDKSHQGKVGDRDYFACSCKTKGKDECNDLLSEVKELLSADDSDLLNKIVYSLEWNYKARITSIACDMWCGIWSQTFDLDKNKRNTMIEPPVFSTEIEGDKVEHVLAATWLAYYKKFGKERIRP